MCEKHCLSHCWNWLTESGFGHGTAASWCLRLRLRAAAQLYSLSKYDIPKAQADLQVALLDARISRLLRGILHFLMIDLM